jgi:hypothetical protein
MVKIQRTLIVLSVVWLLGFFAFMLSVGGKWEELLLIYTFFGLIPVIVINGLWWIIKV